MMDTLALEVVELPSAHYLKKPQPQRWLLKE
jgi:hypothetical protein